MCTTYYHVQSLKRDQTAIPFSIRFTFVEKHSLSSSQEKYAFSLQFTPESETTRTLMIKYLVQNSYKISALTPRGSLTKSALTLISSYLRYWPPSMTITLPNYKTAGCEGKILSTKRILFIY